MKAFKVVTMALIFSPMMAMSCPDLAGNYRCKYKSFTRRVEVTQVKVNNATVYQVDNGGEIFADGQPHQTDTLHPLMDMYASNYNYVAVCNGDAVKVNGTADMSGGQAIVDGQLLKQGKDLAVGMILTTPNRTLNLSLACIRE